MTAGGAITVASAIVIFVAISIGLVSLQSGAEPDSNVGGHGVCEDLGFKYWGPRYQQRFFLETHSQQSLIELELSHVK